VAQDEKAIQTGFREVSDALAEQAAVQVQQVQNLVMLYTVLGGLEIALLSRATNRYTGYRI